MFGEAFGGGVTKQIDEMVLVAAEIGVPCPAVEGVPVPRSRVPLAPCSRVPPAPCSRVSLPPRSRVSLSPYTITSHCCHIVICSYYYMLQPSVAQVKGPGMAKHSSRSSHYCSNMMTSMSMGNYLSSIRLTNKKIAEGIAQK